MDKIKRNQDTTDRKEKQQDGGLNCYRGTFFRYEHYHTRQDTPEKIDYDRLARVTKGLAEVLTELANSKKLH